MFCDCCVRIGQLRATECNIFHLKLPGQEVSGSLNEETCLKQSAVCFLIRFVYLLIFEVFVYIIMSLTDCVSKSEVPNTSTCGKHFLGIITRHMILKNAVATENVKNEKIFEVPQMAIQMKGSQNGSYKFCLIFTFNVFYQVLFWWAAHSHCLSGPQGPASS